MKTKAAKPRCTLCLPVAAVAAAALLSSCVATHRQVFDYGREGGGVLLKGNTQDVKYAGTKIETVPATVYRVGGRQYVAAHPTRYVRRGRSCLLSPLDDYLAYDPTRYEARPDETRTLYGEVVTDHRTGCLMRTQAPWQESLPPGAVQQRPGKLRIPDEDRHNCAEGVILVTSPLHATSNALWAYPLGSAAAVADVPLTAVAIGAAIISGGAYAVYDCFQGHSSPPARNSPRTSRKREKRRRLATRGTEPPPSLQVDALLQNPDAHHRQMTRREAQWEAPCT
ncbi:MAG: hypothetical protein Q4E43_06585 [Akkermansia sp.]|nr:hypothetical protein [Akkermansia sp.]